MQQKIERLTAALQHILSGGDAVDIAQAALDYEGDSC
jgi:hypothetical protein